MSELANPETIEMTVGAKRHPIAHLARGVGDELFILHPQACIEEYDNLSDCPYSLGLDKVVPVPLVSMWRRRWDRTCVVRLHKGNLLPRLAATADLAPPVQLLAGAGAL